MNTAKIPGKKIEKKLQGSTNKSFNYVGTFFL